MTTLRDLRQKTLGLINVSLKDHNLEVHHGQEQSVSIDVEVLVNEVESVLFAIVAKDVLFFVSVAQLHYLASNEVADASSQVDECEAV